MPFAPINEMPVEKNEFRDKSEKKKYLLNKANNNE